MHKLGWIGLGHMGTPMTANLLKAGCKVNVYNRSPEKVVSLVKSGAVKLNSPKEIGENSDIVFIMLSNADAVKDILNQKEGLLNVDGKNKIVVNMSTISPQDSVLFAKMAADKGWTYLDAPVSGSVGAAETSQLVILAGGDEEAIKICQPYFDLLGKATLVFGAAGKGSAAKLTINMLLGIIGEGFGETLLFAEKLGLDREKILDLISKSALNNALFQIKRDMYSKEEFPAAFMVELMSKDLGLIKKEIERMGMRLPLAEAAENTYRSAKENGKAKLDMAAVYLELKDLQKV